MVYTSLSLALAAMEVFVHLEPLTAPDDMVSVAAELPVSEGAVERIGIGRLPKDWRRVDHPVLQRMGAGWLRLGQSLVILVPSVAVEGEWNALVNPAHPDAAAIHVEQAKPFRFDARMFRGMP